MTVTTNDRLGFGLGLRKEHYAELLEAPVAVDWLEILTENYLVPGGKPLNFLDRIRAQYPLVMHGVSLSIGATSPLDMDYLRQVRELAHRIEPRWISDHLCWTGTGGTNLHDLLPLPYNEEALRHLIERITRVQDFLGRQILLENVSSYISYAHSTMTEWEFLTEVANGADCRILLDINNIFVSARNHGFDPATYLNAIPIARVDQFHLAGHRDHGDYIVDTHDAAIIDPVWALYRAAVRRFGQVSTMIERDDGIPPLAELLAELDLARRHAADAHAMDDHVIRAPSSARAVEITSGPPLPILQQALQAHVLDTACATPACIAKTPHIDWQRRIEIYTSGYRLRLIEALTTDYPVLNTMLGAEDFAALASDYIDAHPSRHFSLRWFGQSLAQFLTRVAAYRARPLLAELARFEWTLGEAFDAADADSINLEDIARLPASAWPELRVVMHPSVRQLSLGSLVPGHWRAIQDGASISTSAAPGATAIWRVWRHELRTLFRSLEAREAHSARLLNDATFGELCEHLSTEMPVAEVPAFAAGLLRQWTSEGAIARFDLGAQQADLTPVRKSA